MPDAFRLAKKPAGWGKLYFGGVHYQSAVTKWCKAHLHQAGCRLSGLGGQAGDFPLPSPV